MIFVTVGMHSLGFPRLVRAMDELAATLSEEVVMQIGSTAYLPRHARTFTFADQAEMERLYAEARVVVSHAGAGSILTAQKARVPLILVPRLKQPGEIIDDHQLELARLLNEAGSAIVVEDVGELAQALERARNFPPIAPAQRLQFIEGLQSILAQIEAGRTRRGKAAQRR